MKREELKNLLTKKEQQCEDLRKLIELSDELRSEEEPDKVLLVNTFIPLDDLLEYFDEVKKVSGIKYIYMGNLKSDHDDTSVRVFIAQPKGYEIYSKEEGKVYKVVAQEFSPDGEIITLFNDRIDRDTLENFIEYALGNNLYKGFTCDYYIHIYDIHDRFVIQEYHCYSNDYISESDVYINLINKQIKEKINANKNK